MVKKCFVITEFGSPFSWTQKYINHVQNLKSDGWYWKIFTPNKYDVPVDGNVEVIDMTADQFADLVKERLGVETNMTLSPTGVPSVHVTDFYMFTGVIFESWLKGFDYWGVTNMDIVYGRLSHFLPDSELEKYEVWTDDVGEEGGRVNGIFSLWKNADHINRICLSIPNWRIKLAQPVCEKCMGRGSSHSLYGTDEIDMVPIMQELERAGQIIYGYPKYYPLHSYDRLPQHMPDVNLEIHEGALYEIFKDAIYPNGLGMFNGKTGKEIMYFHFIRTKEWPKSLL